MKSLRATWPAWALALSGLLICAYLTARTLSLAAGADLAGYDVCSALFPTSCDGVLREANSVILGVPWAGWGVAHFAALLVLLGLSAAPGGEFRPAATVGALLLGVAAAAVGLVLSAVLVFGEGSICPLCLLAHAVGLALVPVLKAQCCMSFGEIRAAVTSGLRFTLGLPGERPRSAGPQVIGLLCAFLTALVVFQRVHADWRLGSSTDSADHFEEVLARWQGQHPVDIPIREDDPRLGPVDAPAQLVVFSSLQCPGCGHALEFLVQLQQRMGDRLSVVYKHYPLGTDCNPEMEDDMHPYACLAARAAEAARLQGRFWHFHAKILEVGLDKGPQILDETAADNDLDLVRFARDRAAEAARERVRQDVAIGNQLGLEGTPSIFLNGRALEERRLESLERLIRYVGST